MKKFYSFFFAAVVAIAAIASCTPNEMEDASLATASYGGPNAFRTMLEKTDSLIGHKPINKFEKLNGAETFGFTPVDVYTNDKEIEGDVITFQRPLEVGGEKVDTLYTNNFDFTTKEVRRDSTLTSWDDGVVLWSGNEKVRNISFEMSNGKDKFRFSVWHRSSDAQYWSEDYKVEFPELNWGVSEETFASKEYMTVVRGSMYKAMDFESTVTLTASVVEEFGKDVKEYELVNKLVVLSYIEPDPEDQVTGTYTKAWVEKDGDKLVGVVEKWETHSIIPDVLIDTKKADFTFDIEGGEDDVILVSNFDFTTYANPWRGTGKFNFYPTATNGIEKFDTRFNGRADSGKTILGVNFNAEGIVNVISHRFGEANFIEENGNYFYVRPYTAVSEIVYTVSCEGDSKSLSKTAEYHRDLKMKAPDKIGNDYDNLIYNFEAKAEGRSLTSTINDNSWNYITMNYDNVVSSTPCTVKLYLEAVADALDDEIFTDKAQMGKNNIKSVTKLAASSKRVQRNGHDVDVVVTPYEVVMKNGKKFNIIATYDRPVEDWLGYAEITNITKDSCESTPSGDNMLVTPKFNVSIELHDIRKPATKAGNVKTYSVESPYKELYQPENVLVNKWGEGIATPNKDGFDLTANFYEQWSLEDSPRLIDTQKGKMTFDLTAQDGKDVIAESLAFVTTSNGMKGETNGTYSSTMSNGKVKANNNYNWSADKKASFKHDGIVVEFVATFAINEVETTIGNKPSDKTIDGVLYNAFPYENKVEGVYTIDGQNVTKEASVSRDILVAQPVNELVNRWGEGNITRQGDKLIGTADFYEQWSLEDSPRHVDSQKTEFGFTLKGENGEPVYHTDANFETSGNGYKGNGSYTYTDTAKSGSKSFKNTYTGAADKDVTLSYEGVNVTFNTELVLTEAGQTIGNASTKKIDGVNYNVYPYSNKVNGVYTVTVDKKSASLDGSAIASREIRVKADNFETVNENYDYNFEASANGNVLVSSVNDNIWENNTYNNGVYVSGDKKSMHMNLSVEAPELQDVTFAKKADMGQNDIKSITKLAASAKRVSRDGVAVDEVTTPYEVVMKSGKRFNIVAKYDRPVDGSLSYAEVSNITRAGFANVANGDDVNVTPRYNVSVELHNNAKATKAGNVKNYVIENPYKELYEPVDELVSKRSEGIATPNGNGFDLTANFYETWSLSGEKLVNTQKGKMSATLTGKDGEDVIAENTNFNTTSNGQVGSTSGTYSSTASNGAKSFTNTYNWTADNSKTFSYNGETVSFKGSFKVSENGTTIGSNATVKTVNGVNYNAYPYTNKVQGIYTVDGQSVTLNASSKRNILIKKETPKIIPDNWGKIIGAGITAVPALSVNGIYADTRGNDVKIAHKCLAIRTDKGYIPVVYVMDEVVPTEAQILAGNFTAGNFDASFDSAVDASKNGGWIPAKAQDTSAGIKYTTADGRVRSIQNESLAQWNWRNGNFSTRIDGYTFSVSNDGTLTVIYNGNVVMSIR